MIITPDRKIITTSPDAVLARSDGEQWLTPDGATYCPIPHMIKRDGPQWPQRGQLYSLSNGGVGTEVPEGSTVVDAPAAAAQIVKAKEAWAKDADASADMSAAQATIRAAGGTVTGKAPEDVGPPPVGYLGHLDEHTSSKPGKAPTTRAQWVAYAESAGVSTDKLPKAAAAAIDAIKARAR